VEDSGEWNVFNDGVRNGAVYKPYIPNHHIGIILQTIISVKPCI